MKNQSHIHNEKGFALLGFALLMSVLLGFIFLIVSKQTDETLRRHSVSQAATYADDLAIKFAQKIRWSYDMAVTYDADPIGNAAYCPSVPVPIPPTNAVRLCIPGGQICVPHPRDNRQICIQPGNGSMISKTQTGKYEFIVRHLLVKEAKAQQGRPPPPNPGDTSNVIGNAPICINGRDPLTGNNVPGPCGAVCNGVDSHCISFRFCPLLGICNPNEWFWQTVALLR